MDRRFLIVAAAVLAATTAAHADDTAADRACTRDAMPRAAAARQEIAALFARPEQQGEIVATPTGNSAPMGPVETLMVRRGKDGRLTFVCVHDAAAAERFLAGSADGAPRAKEQ